MRNIPERERLQKWARLWQYARPLLELQSDIGRAKYVSSMHNNSLLASTNALEGQSRQIDDSMSSIMNELIDELQLRHEEIAKRKNVFDILVRNELNQLLEEMGLAMSNLGIESPWSLEKQASGKYHNDLKAIIPLTIRFFRSLSKLKEEERTKSLQDMYSLTFFKPTMDKEHLAEIELLRIRVMHQDQISIFNQLLSPRYPAMLRSASVAIMTCFLEQSEEIDSNDKLRLIKSAVEIPSYGLLRATLSQLNSQEKMDGQLWLETMQAALAQKELDVELIKTLMSILDNNFTLQKNVMMINGRDSSIFGGVCVEDLLYTSRLLKLICAIYRGDITDVDQLIQVEADINMRIGVYYTWSNSEFFPILQSLFEEVDQIKAQVIDKDWTTPLMLAILAGHDDVAMRLIDAGAEVDEVDTNNQTALMLASANGYAKVVRSLIEIRANIDAKDTNGQTALMMACAAGHESVVSQLIEAGANSAAEDKNGESALLLASTKGHDAVVKKLLEAKAWPGGCNNNGETALMLACAGGHKTVVSTLIEDYDSHIDSFDNKGKTAFDRARAHKDEEMMLILEKAQKGYKEKVRNFEKSELGQRILGILCDALCSKLENARYSADDTSSSASP